MSSRRVIRDLITAYTYAMDDGNWQALEELFRDGEFRLLGDGFVGPAGIRRFVSGLILHDGQLRTKHVNTNVTMDVDKRLGRATARSYWTVLQAFEGFPLQPVTAGQYLDTFARDQDGWHFKLRVCSIDLYGDTSAVLPSP